MTSQHRICLLALSLLGVVALNATGTDPFSSGQPSWMDAIAAAKPNTLEIAFGETNTALPTAPNDSDHGTHLVTPDFLKYATQLHVAVGNEDQGRVVLPEKVAFVYRLTSKTSAHAIDLSIDLPAVGGRRQIHTSITVSPDQWIVAGAFTREEMTTTKSRTTTTKKFTYVALRLRPAPPADAPLP